MKSGVYYLVKEDMIVVSWEGHRYMSLYHANFWFFISKKRFLQRAVYLGEL